MDTRAIGIFDSGVGGLTVFSELRKKLSNEDIIYLGDTQNFPYGDKSKEKIIELAIKNAQILMSKDVKMIIIACGTATSQAIHILKEKFDIPIIGIIESTVKYLEKQNIKEIGVIATEGTIRSGAWEDKLKENIKGIKVINKACPMLATIAEQGRAESEEGKRIIKEYMKPFKADKINKIILGCTHYPIYEKLIRKELEYDVELINTGVTVTEYVEKFLKANELQNEKKVGKYNIYLTKPEKEFKDIAKNIMQVDIDIEAI
ncbi:MAG: glutamate racemase [Clostridia bacterium]|nr:glutamate racemase [Clostridia bacterium]